MAKMFGVLVLPAGGAVKLFSQSVKSFVLEALCFHHPETALKMSKINMNFKAINCCGVFEAFSFNI